MTDNRVCNRCLTPWNGFGYVCNSCRQIEEIQNILKDRENGIYRESSGGNSGGGSVYKEPSIFSYLIFIPILAFLLITDFLPAKLFFYMLKVGLWLMFGWFLGMDTPTKPTF